MLCLVLGEFGSGKTLLLVQLAKYFSHYPIYSNFKLFLPNVEKLKLSELFNIERGVIYLDEAYTFLESRLSSSQINLYLSYLLAQSRKRQLNFFLTAQLLSMIDLRFRRQANLLVYAQDMGDFFLYYITKIGGLQKIVHRFVIFRNYAKKHLYHLYKTQEVIVPRNFPQLQYSFLDDTDKFSKAQEIAKQILNDFRGKDIKWTHNRVKYELLKREKLVSKELEQFVYVILNSDELVED